jgi:hypothetical protein
MHYLNILVLIRGTNLASQARSTHAICRHILTSRCETQVTLVNVFLASEAHIMQIYTAL